MPLQIVRNDITRMQVDAIVNSTNPALIGAGLGVDGSIHAAAGERLEEELCRIGFCPVGSAVVTPSYNIAGCSCIIHAVAPYYDEENSEELLRKCYRKVFELALEKDCSSLALPVLSAGEHAFPPDDAYSIACTEIRTFLSNCGRDIFVYLVLFSTDVLAVSEMLNDEVTQYITDNYIGFNKESLLEIQEKKVEALLYHSPAPSESLFGTSYEFDDAPCFSYNIPAAYEKPAHAEPSCSAARPEKDKFGSAAFDIAFFELDDEEDEDKFMIQDRSFAEMCQWWMERKGMTASEFYSKANITKALFWNMKNHPEQVPKKTTALACVIGLRLNLDEANDLLRRAGLALSPYYETDVVVEYYIKKGIFNIDEINLELFERDLSILGSVAI